jgi:2'-5' RNA ligase
VRLFVAVWPSAETLETLDHLPRPVRPGVRWTTRDQWHVTLLFLGEVSDAGVPAAADAVRRAAAECRPFPVSLGPRTVLLSPWVLCAPVDGLVDAAAAVGRVAVGEGTSYPYRGHLTLARGRRRLPAELTGVPVASRWLVDELCLVSSVLDRRGARYETVERAPLEP